MLPSPSISTWFINETEEDGMFDDHTYLWRRMIDILPQKDLSGSRVLDYGCNRGGFLHMLHNRMPYTHGLGVDVAQASLAVARQRSKDIPVDFVTPDRMRPYINSIALAFSHEVLYLLPDLTAHAMLIDDMLEPGGSYYAAIGCHTANPLWPRWKKLIAASSSLPIYDYTLDDYARAFWNAGMTVEMRPFQMQDFVPIKQDNPYFPSAADSLHYYDNIKTIIKATKRG